MPAYLIGMMNITDPEEFTKYQTAAGRALQPFQGRFKRLSADRHPTVYEGELPAGYMFVIEFDSRELFEKFYQSSAYQEALKIRNRSSAVKTVMLMEGAMT